MTPHSEADVAGWSWRFTVELEGTCDHAWGDIEIPDYLAVAAPVEPLAVPDGADRARAFIAGDGEPADPAVWQHDGELVAALLDDLAASAWTSLGHTRLGAPAHVYLNHGVAAEDGEFLALSIIGWGPVVEGDDLRGYSGSERSAHKIIMAPRLQLQLRRPCAPGAGEAPWPLPEALLAHAVDQVIDARCLTERWKPVVSMLTAAWCGDSYAGVAWERMEPVNEGRVAGWDWTFTLELGGCCGDGSDYVVSPEGGYRLANDYAGGLMVDHLADVDPHPVYAKVVQAGARDGRRVVVVFEGDAVPAGLVAGDLIVEVDGAGDATVRAVL